MNKHRRIFFSVSIVINLLIIVILVSPFIPIKNSFNENYYDSSKTIILIEHSWNDQSNTLLATGDEVFDYIKGKKDIDYINIDIDEYRKVNLLNKDPFIYISLSIYPEEKSTRYILLGDFNSDLKDKFYVDDWYEVNSKTLLGQTKFYKGDGIINIIYFPCLILVIPSIILSIVIFSIYRRGKRLDDYKRN